MVKRRSCSRTSPPCQTPTKRRSGNLTDNEIMSAFKEVLIMKSRDVDPHIPGVDEELDGYQKNRR